MFGCGEGTFSFAICFSGNDVSKNGKDNKGNAPDNLETENPNRRFLQCPGSVTVNHLKKFIITKYGLDDKFVVDVIYRDDLLAEGICGERMLGGDSCVGCNGDQQLLVPAV